MAVALGAMVLIMAVCCAAQSGPPEVRELAKGVDSHYDHLRSLKEHFEENYRGAGVERSESGTLWLRRPGKMRWQYDQPRQKVFVSDGKNIYFYVAGEAQASRASVKKADDLRTPLRFLLGKTKLEKEFDDLREATSADSQPGDFTLRGVPRALRSRVREVELEINPSHQIVRVLIEENDGSSTRFRFSAITENAPAPDRLFHFSPPPGVAVIDSPELTN